MIILSILTGQLIFEFDFWIVSVISVPSVVNISFEYFHGPHLLQSIKHFAKRQPHHIRVRTHDSSYHKGPSPLNGVPPGLVKRLPGRKIPSDLCGGQGPEEDPGG
jgi:hypothetical protein